MDENERRLNAYRRGARRSGGPSGKAGSSAQKGRERAGAADTTEDRSVEPTSPIRGFQKTVSEEGLDRAARLLVALGTEKASEVLKHLPDDQVEAVMARVAATKAVRRSEVESWLQEMQDRSRKRPESGRLDAGPEVAASMLQAAFGEERAAAFMKTVQQQRGEKRFAFLAELEPQQIVTLLREESDAVISVVLGNMPTERAASVLASLPEDRKQGVGVRLARMDEVGTETLDRIEEGLRGRIEQQGTVKSEEVDGREALARILRFMNVREEDEILRDLAESDPQLSEDVRDRLFTLDTLEYIDDADLSRVLREFDDRTIALILKGKEEKTRSHIMRNVSTRRRERISEEYAHLGPVRKRDADEAVNEFLRYLKDLEEEGRLLVRRPNDEYI
jgi:flagellar motor switch protein FliG